VRLRFFFVPAVGSDAAEAELNRFLATHRVSRVEKSFVADGAASGWALAVTWIEGDVPSAAGATDATVRRAEGRKVDAAVLAVLRDALPAGAAPLAQQASVGPPSSGGAAP
jgi:hypothetical protein